MKDNETAILKAEASKLSELYKAKKDHEQRMGRKFTQHDIAKIGGWTQPNVSAYLRGIVPLQVSSAEIFAEALGVSVQTFSPRLAAIIAQRDLYADFSSWNGMTVSFVPTLTPQVIDSIRNQLKDKDFIMPSSKITTPITNPVSAHAYGIEVLDQSCLPEYPAGTTIIFDPSLKPEPTDLVYVGNKFQDGDYHIREYKITEIEEDGSLRYKLIPKNNSFPTLGENYEILGVAISASKTIRKVSQTL
ncbi:helix-turn-helix domain-containing protein [uncultured Acinetobacter sp.]|uniref:helix-turn-helix domain-containing protein n=1 Tax=uncultured Acinetobacter sp. TaxID=165433 RepID=UPI0037495643